MLIRPLLLIAVGGLLLLPDWSTARPFRRRVLLAPHPCPTSFQYAPPVVYSPPVYSMPVYCPPIYTPPSACPPATPAPKGPTVIPERMAELRATDQKPPMSPMRPGTASEAKVEPKPIPPAIRPVGHEDRLPPMQVPLAPPRAVGAQPAPPTQPVEFATPRPIAEESQKPPMKPEPLPAFPRSDKDKEAKPDALPTFDLPPLPPLPPPAGSDKPTTVKSSPVNADPPVEIYPLAGPAPADSGSRRRVGFVNKSGRDLALTIDGRRTTLPSGHAVQWTLPAKFVWQIGGEKESEVSVPDSAPGLDVVIRR